MPEKTNPYVAGAPVTDRRMFFGREDVFTWIEHNIGGQFSDNMLVIHGQRRVGKTSVLKQLGNYISDKYIPVFFDFQGRTHTTLNRFLYRLAREIVRTLSREHDIKVARPDREDFEQDAEQFAGPFLSQVREALGDKNLVLVFDEFDTLEERTARDMLGQYLVPYFSRMVHGAERLNFIFSIGSSGHKLEDMRAEYTDFFRVGLYKRISFLSPPDARRLIAEPVRGIMDYEEDAIDRIVEITSGHPYFIQLLCHELFARAQRMDDWHIDLMDVEEVLPDVIERGTVNLKFVWDVATSSERYALAALAEMGREATKEEVLDLLQEHKVRISDEEVGHALLELNARDVLSKQNGFTVELLRLWLLENRPLKRVIEELSEKHPVAVRHTQIAEEYREQDQIEGALENYQSALASAPNYIPARLGMAEIYQESGRWLEAVEAYQKVLTIDASSDQAKTGLSETLVALGDAAREAGDVEGALERYREALEVNEEHTEARERLAGLYLAQSETQAKQGKWQPAGESLLTAWEYIPEGIQIEEKPSPTALQDLENVEQLQEVIAPLREALASMRAELAREQLNRALKLREGKKYSAALTRLEKALAYDPDLEEVQREIRVTRELERDAGLDKMYTAGQRAFRAQRWGEAISTLQRYLEFEPEDESQVKQAQAWIEEARVQEELAERYAAARQAMDRGVTRRALALLREIRDVAGEYRDTEQLLDQVRMKWRGGVLRQAALWGGIAILMGIVGWWLLKPGGALQPAAVGWGLYDNTPTATATALPPTSTPPATQPPSPTPEPTSVPLAWQRLTSAQFITRDLVTSIAIDPNDPDVWYVGMGNAGIYKSINGGVSWLPIQKGLGHTQIDSLVIDQDDPQNLYAGTVMGIYKTGDGGQSWQAVNHGIHISNNPNAGYLSMDPQDSRHLFYTDGHNIYETVDGAESWDILSAQSVIGDCGGPQRARFSPVDSQTLFVLSGAPHDDGCSGVFKSTDGGETWKPTELEVTGEYLQNLWIDNVTGDYLQTDNGHTGTSYHSSDSGETWQEITNWWCNQMVFHPENGLEAYCLESYGEIQKSINGGQSWQVIGKVASRESKGAIAISPHDPRMILVGVNGLYVSIDGGYTWEERSSGLGASHLQLLADPLRDSTFYLVNRVSDGPYSSLYRTSDGGANWEIIEDEGKDLVIDANGQVLYRIGDKDRGQYLLISKDGGDNWEALPYLPSNVTAIFDVMADPDVSGKLYVQVMSSEGDPNQEYYSTDGGETWEKKDAGIGRQYGSEQYIKTDDQGRILANELAVDPRNSDIVYAATDSGAYASFDGGKNWSPINDGLLGGLVVYSIVVDETSNVYAATPLGIFVLENK